MDILSAGRTLEGSNDGLEDKGKQTTIKTQTKIERVLIMLFEGERLNRFEAIGHGDTALNTTISTLKNTHGICIARRRIKVKTRWGDTSLKEYWLSPSSYDRASKLLDFMRQRREHKKKGC